MGGLVKMMMGMPKELVLVLAVASILWVSLGGLCLG
jgi:hypothetical protein